jgi:hypothetical protein
LNSCANDPTSSKSADEYQPFKTFKPFNRVAPFKPFNINELVQIVQAVQSLRFVQVVIGSGMNLILEVSGKGTDARRQLSGSGHAEGWGTRGCEESVIMSPGGNFHVFAIPKT